MARPMLGGGEDEDLDELVESSKGPSEPLDLGRFRKTYTPMEAWPYIAATVLVVVVGVVIILYAAWLEDVWGASERPLEDVTRSATVELRTEGVDPGMAYGPHTFALNVTLAAGDLLTVEVTTAGPADGVEAFIQHPLHPVNASSMPATVHSMGAGTHVALELEAMTPGAYQVYIIHPGAVRPPPSGVDPFDWQVPAQVTYTITVARAE